jgi:hypothetical protein
MLPARPRRDKTRAHNGDEMPIQVIEDIEEKFQSAPLLKCFPPA